MRITLFLFLAVFSLIGAWAYPTGLNAIPTANILDPLEARVDYESGGSGKLFVPEGATLYGTQIGLLLGLEVGMDRISDHDSVYNLKWRLKGEGLVTPAFAVGVQNVAHGMKSQYYAVATKKLLLADFSAGTLRADGDTMGMIGVEGKLGPITVKADHVTGQLNRTSASVGFTWQNVTLTGTTYDIKDVPNEQTVMLSYTRSAL